MLVGLGANTCDGFVKEPGVAVPGGNDHRDQGLISELPAADSLFVKNILRQTIKALPIIGVCLDRNAGLASNFGQACFNPFEKDADAGNLGPCLRDQIPALGRIGVDQNRRTDLLLRYRVDRGQCSAPSESGPMGRRDLEDKAEFPASSDDILYVSA